MMDDIRWLEVPMAEWQATPAWQRGLGIYDEASRTVRVLQVKFCDSKDWCTVPIIKATPKPPGQSEEAV